MDEASARDLVAVRAIEIIDRDRTFWSDADRAWASRAAAEAVTAKAQPEEFLVRRARLARERLEARFPSIRRTVQAFSWPRWITPAVLAAALVVGVAVDRIGSEARIDVLAPPILGLIVWNMAVYLILAWRAVRAVTRPGREQSASVRDWLARVAAVPTPLTRWRADAPVAASLAQFGADWARVSGGLYAARAARLLHLAAAVLALGMVAGFYMRGLALEYRASWQSTFLDAEHVHRIVSIALAPGAWLTGLVIPTVEHIARLRTAFPDRGENAALWLHLYAATVLIIVLVPRVLLAAWAGVLERRRARALPVALRDPYFRRLVRSFVQGPLRIAVIPYSYTLSAPAAEALRAIVTRAFGPCDVTVAERVAYGAEDTLEPPASGATPDVVLAVFNATGTPESEAHGAFLAGLAAGGRQGEPVAILDESSFRERWPHDESRLAARRKAWRQLFTATSTPCVFADLKQADLEGTAEALQRAAEHAS